MGGGACSVTGEFLLENMEGIIFRPHEGGRSVTGEFLLENVEGNRFRPNQACFILSKVENRYLAPSRRGPFLL